MSIRDSTDGCDGALPELTAQQENDLIRAGVSRHVVTEMQLINADERDRLRS